MNRLHRYCLLALLPLSAAFGQAQWSALAFGDYYYVAAHNDDKNIYRNGFQFRRIYLTYDHELDDNLSARLRFEMTSADFTAKAAPATPIVKDAYLQWRRGNQRILLGLAPTPTIGLVTQSWGYRSVAKTPLHLHKLGESRDFGIAIKGQLASHFDYHIMLGNGNGTASENNYYKKFYGSLSHPVGSQGLAELYVDFEQDDPGLTTITSQLHLQVDLTGYHVGLLAARRTETYRDPQDLISVYLRTTGPGSFKLFGRLDYLTAPNPQGGKIKYTPMSTLARPMVIIAGVDLQLHEKVSLLPHIISVLYSVDDGDTPPPDIYLRLTSVIKF